MGQEATMPDDASKPDLAHNAAPRGRRYRHHVVELADRGRLVLSVDGSIQRSEAAGATTGVWTPEDPGWPDQALRFGIRPQAMTVAPHVRRDQGSKTPG
jgi:hypothetical protein